jgi:hypothetical protein
MIKLFMLCYLLIKISTIYALKINIFENLLSKFLGNDIIHNYTITNSLVINRLRRGGSKDLLIF